MRGLFVTATDTGVGKTVLAGALSAAMVAAGERVRAHKPVLTGLDDSPQKGPGGVWPRDHELLARAAGMASEEVAPLRFGAATSPHLAARLAGEPIEAEQLLEAAKASLQADAITVVEGVGGLLVPLSDDYTVCDLARELALPVVIAARPGLGTINHTLLTLHGARAAGLEVRAVVLTPWPDGPSEVERSNRETIERLGEVPVFGLAPVRRPEVADLARAGEKLPWRSWVMPTSPLALVRATG